MVRPIRWLHTRLFTGRAAVRQCMHSAVMKMQVVLFLIALSGLGIAHFVEEDNVLVLTKENFQLATGTHQFVLVEFYSPECIYCQELAPEYAEAARQLKEERSEIWLAKVDTKEETELAKNYSIEIVPNMTFFSNGIAEKHYTGKMKSDEIVLWLKKQTGPLVQDLATPEQASAFSKTYEVVVVGLFQDAESEAANAFISAAAAHYNIYFGITSSQEVANSMNATLNSIIVFNQLDEGRHAAFSWQDTCTTEDISHFITIEQIPLVTKFNQETAMNLFDTHIKHVLLTFFSGEAEDYDTVMRNLRDVATAFKGKVRVVYIDTTDQSFDVSGAIKLFEVKDEELPTARMTTIKKGTVEEKNAPTFSGLDAADLKPWIQDYLKGKFQVEDKREDSFKSKETEDGKGQTRC